MTAAPIQSGHLSPGFTPAGHDSPPEDAPLSPPEEAILEAIAHPGADLPALAAAHNRSLLALALWIREPRVQRALDALLDLLALQRKLWQDEVTKEAIETLRKLTRTEPNPVERRRASTAILRASASFSLREKVAESSRPDEGVSRPHEPDAQARVTEPDAQARVTEPEAQARVTEPDAQARVTAPEAQARALPPSRPGPTKIRLPNPPAPPDSG